MKTKKRIALSKMKASQYGFVVAINGGHKMVNKLRALGVYVGVRVIRKNRLLGPAPVIIMVGNTEIAIGYSMAARIVVEVDYK